jgi:acyl-CoA synthetase (AMP-forming)/AMP-acid ligase II/pimeloyl-ACP methyl ester carboxylesterase
LRRWGLEPSWSRQVTFTGSDGEALVWHVLDTGPGPRGTIVCVHGNPSWGYLWRDVLATLSPDWRVIAVDQTGMGYSQRAGRRGLADRVDELARFCRQEVGGPLVLAAHDWGGPIAVGAAGSLDVRALILANTAVAKPEGVRVPPLIGVARRFVDLVCRRTPAFVDGAAAMTARSHRQALRAPYRSADRRSAIADFVADIPVGPHDPSFGALARSASVLASLACPVLILWGGKDPVFHDRFLRDLRGRVPHAHVERFATAGHFVCLDEPVGAVIGSWIDRAVPEAPAATAPSDAVAESPVVSGDSSAYRPVLTDLENRSEDGSPVYRGPDGSISWAALALRSASAAAVLRESGVERGDRVGLLVEPGVDLLVAAVAVWRAGGVVVVADASAGLRQLRSLFRAAAPSHVVGTPTALGAASAGRFAPGARLSAFASVPGVADLRRAPGGRGFEPVRAQATDIAAIVHTSGATGPAKPVRYTHGALAAQRSALAGLFDVGGGEAFTTSFAPFMLLAPAIGMCCVRPDFDVDKPAEFTFDALAKSLEGTGVTTAWLSPASARTIVSTAAGREAPIPLVMLAGAPIPASLVRDVRHVTAGEVRAPYGMTECLPVTDGVDPERIGPLGGTATGRPLPGCDVVIVGLDDVGGPGLGDGSWGEILVSAPWMFDGYDARWIADAASTVVRVGRRYHRTGDVGYLSDGVLFQLGRAQHVIRTAAGPVPSVSAEEPVAEALGRRVAAVAVGPAGSAVVAIVVEAPSRLHLASSDVAAVVRAASREQVAAVVEGPMPTDRRHQSKVDRTDLAASVGRFLAGR